jgi:hypothetical protein
MKTIPMLCLLLAGVTGFVRGADLSLPTSEEAFLGLVRRAFVESDASILVVLSFRELPGGNSVSLASVRQTRQALISRGLQSLSLDPIEPPGTDIIVHGRRMTTNLPARWRLKILHPTGATTTLFVGSHNGTLYTLHQEQAKEARTRD